MDAVILRPCARPASVGIDRAKGSKRFVGSVIGDVRELCDADFLPGDCRLRPARLGAKDGAKGAQRGRKGDGAQRWQIGARSVRHEPPVLPRELGPPDAKGRKWDGAQSRAEVHS